MEISRENTNSYIAVGAIDFGTSYSGYAFSFKYDPEKIQAKAWYSGENLSSSKTPTCILFDTDGNFHAFGYEAEEAYSGYCLDGQQNDWYFFREYKMALYDQMHATKTLKINDIQGRPFPLFTLVTESIRYLKDDLIHSCQRCVENFEDTDIHWVLTVPAIWTESAKHFMREAAEAAGIPGLSLSICLEPEAAAVYCKTVPCKISTDNSIPRRVTFQEGDSYLLFDAGGGTVDMIVHTVGENGKLKELHEACGGNWGGGMVDAAFLEFLQDICGQRVIYELQKSDVYDFLYLMRDFENKKRSIDILSDQREIHIKIPPTLQAALQPENTYSWWNFWWNFVYYLLSYIFHYLLFYFFPERNKLSVPLKKILSFFDTSTAKIGPYLTKLLAKQDLTEVKTIVMVGGYSESLILQEFIKNIFSSKTVIVPKEAGLAVLKGAVLYGHDPSVIVERRCRFTFGFKTRKHYKENIHRESTKYTDNFGNVLVRDCFDVYVKAGQTIKTGVYQPEKTYFPYQLNHQYLLQTLYACPRQSPIYVTDPDCIEIGKLKVDISDLTGSAVERAILVSLCFSGTEIKVTARKKQTGEVILAEMKYDWC